MDIVQYLHALVSVAMGLSQTDGDADLLKQYYALCVARIGENDLDVHNPNYHDVRTLWGEQTAELVRRLARSFHQDQRRVFDLLCTATPHMMTELAGLMDRQSAQAFIAEHFGASRLHLPAWSGQFIEGKYTAHNSQALPRQLDPLAFHETRPTNRPIQPNDGEEDEELDDLPNKRRLSPLVLALGVGLLLVSLGAGVWYLLKKEETPPTLTPPSTAPAPTLNAPRLSLTTGENGTLYACQAEVGSSALHTELLGILQKNFGEVNCIIDIDESFGGSLTGLERLESIIVMMKSQAFTSIEVVGDQIIIGSPKDEVMTRMVQDIALLAPQFRVSAIPPLDKNSLIAKSLASAKMSMEALGETPTAYELARTASLQILDFNGSSQVPAPNMAVLTLLAQKLISNPDIKLIIATHTDGSNADRQVNVKLSQAQAEAVRTFLIQNGVPQDQLIAKGVGDTFPVADNLTETGQFKNRRTEFLVADNDTLKFLTQKVAQAIPKPPPQMLQTAPYVPAYEPQTDPNAVPMPVIELVPPDQSTPSPVQGMPPPALPEPVRQSPPSPPASQGVIHSVPDSQTTGVQEIVIAPPTTPSVPDIPPEVMELSRPIGTETGKGKESQVR